MKVFLSALENGGYTEYIDKHVEHYHYNLMSYYYLEEGYANRIKEKSKMVVIDSGAHSFQTGTVVDFEEFTKEYADFIQRFDCDKVLGYFEMDIDPAGIPMERVLKLRKILTDVSDKIIPVWHKGRGIQDFKDMVNNPIHKDKIVAITGWRNLDIKDEDLIKFFSYAHKRGVKVFCLAMTRTKILEQVPFDYVDSSSWKHSSIYGKVGKNIVSREFSKENGPEVALQGYLEGMRFQEYWEKYWTPWRIKSEEKIRKKLGE